MNGLYENWKARLFLAVVMLSLSVAGFLFMTVSQNSEFNLGIFAGSFLTMYIGFMSAYGAYEAHNKTRTLSP